MEVPHVINTDIKEFIDLTSRLHDRAHALDIKLTCGMKRTKSEPLKPKQRNVSRP